MSLDLRQPTTIAEAIGALSEEDSLPLAGGLSVVLLMNTGLLDPTRLVSLARIPGLDSIKQSGDVIEIGPMCTHGQLSGDSVMRSMLPEVADMFGHIGNVRVRAWATLGGNLAHADPAQDPPVMLGALGANVVAQGPSGVREIPVSELADGLFSTQLAPDELITAIHVPIPPADVCCAYTKFLPRTADDYATVSAAARIAVTDDGVVKRADLVLGSVGPTPVFATEAANALVGRPLGDRRAIELMVETVRRIISPPSDVRGSSEYRREMAGVIARRSVLACGSN